MAGAVRADMGTAGFAVDLGGDRLEDRADPGIGFIRPARHDRGPMPGALLAAGDAGAGEQQAALAQRPVAPDGVRIAGIAAIDDQIARLEQRRQRIDLLVGRLAGLDHRDDRARAADRRDQVLERQAGDQRKALGLVARDERLGPAGGPVEDGGAVTVLGDVEREVLAHDGEADQADVRLPAL